jgi:hypothetical protein
MILGLAGRLNFFLRNIKKLDFPLIGGRSKQNFLPENGVRNFGLKAQKGNHLFVKSVCPSNAKRFHFF